MWLSFLSGAQVVGRVYCGAGAGAGALIPDSQYEEAGARSVRGRWMIRWRCSGLMGGVKVAAPTADEIARLRSDGVLIGFLAPSSEARRFGGLRGRGVTSLRWRRFPRISRAQSMDALSSQANISGYRSALIGAQELGRYYPMLVTAAGAIRPAAVSVLGAGVAGLQAIARARRLGPVVQEFDVRSVVKQVQSLGATFLELDLGGDLEGAGGYAK